MNGKQKLVEIPRQDVPQGLPKTVPSLCPECKKIIKAVISEENGKIVMRKTCPEHGDVFDIVSGHADLYKKMSNWAFADWKGLSNPQTHATKQCPMNWAMLMHYFKILDCDLIPRSVESWARPLGWPSFTEVPAQFFFTGIVQQNNGAVFAFDLAIHDQFSPIPEFSIIGDTPL